jgi:hypothetical protein
MRRVKWALSLLGAGALIALSAPMVSALTEGELPPGYDATVVLNGHEVPATPGTVIAVGQAGSAGCEFRTFRAEVSGRVPDDMGPAAMAIRIEVDELCQMVVSSVEVITPPAPPPATDSGAIAVGTAAITEAATTAVNHYGWAKGWVEEYVNIPVTRTNVEMKYKRDGGRVFGGSAGSCWPWNDGGGWTVRFESCNWNPSGPNQVWIKGQYHFSSWIPPQPSYSLSAKFRADPGPGYSCSLTNGSRPWGWGFECDGGVYY